MHVKERHRHETENCAGICLVALGCVAVPDMATCPRRQALLKERPLFPRMRDEPPV